MKALPFMFQCRWLLLSSLSLFTHYAASQNLRCTRIPSNQQVLLDTAIIEPGSVSASFPFEFDVESRIIRVSTDLDSAHVCYRVLAPLLTQKYKNRELSTYDSSGDEFIINNLPIGDTEKEELFSFSGIQKFGAITRGVTFGNRQSLFVNSTLNLQMQGKLDENLNLSAVITDQNVPYQPEGNTQQIRDFDNVFIKLYNENFSVIAGDVVLQQPTGAGYFLKYYKNIQGLQATVTGGKDWKYETRLSGAVSKGKFNSAFLEAIDGLSGPYKLRGPNGERFIIVLANSEKVFLDGKLLERGFDRDYVIDYNLGEITFNNHIVITQFSIIRVDYEYAEQFYSRSNISAYQSIEKDQVRFYANYYRERDNPNGNLGFALSESDVNQLRSIGDDVNQAFITGFDSVRFNENRILYEQVDTTDISGTRTTIFRYSIDPDRELFSPTFSEVGVGNGNYQLRETAANGRIYEWISPINGVPQGNYEPGSFIPLPNKRQLVTLGAEVSITKYESLTTEIAFSDRDNNLYSEIDDGDNQGHAVFSSFKSEGRATFLPDYYLSSSISVEYDQQDFTFIDRYRSPLFDRDWNFDPGRINQEDDLLAFGKLGLIKDPFNQIVISVNRRKRGTQVDGWQQQVDLNQQFGNFEIRSTHFRLENDQGLTSSSWFRSKSDLSYHLGKIVPGVIYEVDNNREFVRDSVFNTLMNFRATELYLVSGDSSSSGFRFSYQLRRDRLPQQGEIRDYLDSRNFRGSYIKNGEKGRLSFDLNYRRTNDLLGLNVGEDEVINGRVNWRHQFFKRILNHNLSYSIGNGRELRREFVYLPVNTGEGTHTWRDVNEDGVQDLDEFFEAINPDERNFVKIFTPTDDYITSFQTFYLHTIDLRTPLVWKRQGGLRSFASNFSANINLNVNYKTTSTDLYNRLNPFALNLNSSALIATQDSKRYTLFYNRNGRGFSADLTRQARKTKQLLIQGFEIREGSDWVSNFKIDITSEYTFRIISTLGNQLNRSDFLDSRNFDLRSNLYNPQLIWQPTGFLRVIVGYERKHRRNKFLETSNESAITETISGDLTWNQTAKGSIRARVSLLRINFKGDPSNYLGYLLLDGLQPGNNQTWQLNVQRRLSKGMQLSLLYNGRKSQGQQTIHTGTVQVTAFF